MEFACGCDCSALLIFTPKSQQQTPAVYICVKNDKDTEIRDNSSKKVLLLHRFASNSISFKFYFIQVILAQTHPIGGEFG